MVKLRDGRKILGGRDYGVKAVAGLPHSKKRGAAYPSQKALRVKSRPCVFGAKKRRYGLAGTKWPRRFCLTALARRSPRARLYSVEPRSSQWPSTVTWASG